MKKKKEKNLELRNKILHFVNAGLGALVIILAFVSLAFINGEETQPLFCYITFVFIIFFAIFTEVNAIFIRWDRRTLLESLIPAAIYSIIMMVMLFFSSEHNYQLVGYICLTVYYTLRLGKIVLLDWRTNKTKSGKIGFSVFAGIIHLIILIYPLITYKSIISFLSFYSFIFVIEGVVLIFMSITIGAEMKALGRVLIKTHASEFLVGLVIMILTASLILTFVEPKLENYGDALWYCFAIVTTIGFGDFSAVTLSGRLVSVFLGIYGIVVLALFTSIIVNLYNETKNETSKAKKIEEKKNEETPIEEEKEKPQEEEQLVEEKEK